MVWGLQRKHWTCKPSPKLICRFNACFPCHRNSNNVCCIQFLMSFLKVVLKLCSLQNVKQPPCTCSFGIFKHCKKSSSISINNLDLCQRLATMRLKSIYLYTMYSAAIMPIPKDFSGQQLSHFCINLNCSWNKTCCAQGWMFFK